MKKNINRRKVEEQWNYKRFWKCDCDVRVASWWTMATETPSSSSIHPLIPPTYLGLDVPTQRRYALSLGILLQVISFLLNSMIEAHYNWKCIKLTDLFVSAFVPTSENSHSHVYYFCKWLIIDTVFVVALPRLRIPKLTFAWQASCLQLLLFCFFNFLLFGTWSVRIFRNLLRFNEQTISSSWAFYLALRDFKVRSSSDFPELA